MLAVFIVENETPLLRLLGWALLEEGLKVARATSLEDAIIRLSESPSAVLIINAAVSQQILRDWVVRLREVTPDARIVALRTPGLPDDPGVDAYVEQPYRVDDLLRTIDANQ